MHIALTRRDIHAVGYQSTGLDVVAVLDVDKVAIVGERAGGEDAIKSPHDPAPPALA
jgi:hypothetical protein